MIKTDKKRDIIIWAVVAVAIVIFVIATDLWMSAYARRILMLGAIYCIMAVGLNITFGMGGIFSLGHCGFMAIGCYIAIVLTLSADAKQKNWYVAPIAPFFEDIIIPFGVSLLISCVIVALFAILVGYALLRLRSDYLGMATLCLGEIIRVVINNQVSLFNGSLGLKYFPDIINPYLCFGLVAVCVAFAVRLRQTSYGYAIRAAKDDDIAAEACGIKITWHRVFAFTVGAVMAGIGGVLLGLWNATVSPKMFTSTQTYTIVLIVVAGGLGNITGTVIASFGVAIIMEWLRFVEEPMMIFGWQYPGISGMRMLFFAVSLLVIIIKFKNGLFGSWEFTPSIFYTKPKFISKLQRRKASKGEEDRHEGC